MSMDSNSLKLIIGLNKLTVQDELKWEVETPPAALLRATDDVIPLYFECKYKDQRIGLFERRFKDFSSDFEQIYWSSHVCIALIDAEGRVLLELSDTSSVLHDLYGTVRRKASNVDALVKQLSKDFQL